MSDSLPPFPADRKILYGDSPNTAWTYATKVDATPEGKAWVEGEKAGWTVVDTAEEDPMKVYRLMISGVVPRPVGFVSSVSESGTENLAPFSWFNMVSHDPPMVSISVTNPGGKSLKDTSNNIKATKGFVVNIISEPFIEQANVTCIDTPPDVSEWELSGLTKAPSVLVKAPRVKESAFSMECELYQALDIEHPTTGKKGNTLILGHVKKIHVRNDVLLDRHSVAHPGDIVKLVDPAKLRPVARLGDISYSGLGPLYRLPRPDWKADKEKIAEAVAKAGEAA